jgi:hypothetical protein
VGPIKRVRVRITYANVVSTLALFLVLGGGAAFAATKLTTSDIKKGAIKTKLLAKNAVSSAKIASNAVKTRNIAPSAVGGKQLAADSVDGSKVLNGSLTPADLLGGASVVATATGGPADPGSTATPLPLNGGTWTQGATENDLVAVRLEATIATGPPPALCQVIINFELDGTSVGTAGVLSSSSTPSTMTSEVLGGVRLAPGTATPRQLKATASAVAFIGSCQTAHINSVKVSVLGVG